MREIYVVHGNEDCSGYGDQHYIYGVFDDEQAAKITQRDIRRKIFKRAKLNDEVNLESAEEVDVQILTIPKNKIVEEYLGGYSE